MSALTGLADGPRIMPHGTPGDRMAPLTAWLDANHATLMWEAGRPSSSTVPVVRCYLIQSVPVLVSIFSDGRGWELFTPSAPHSNRISDSLAAATAAIGRGCRLPEPEEPAREPR